MVLVNEVLRERKPQTGAAIAPGHQRMKDALAEFLGYAGPGVENFHRDDMAVAPARERHLSHHARAQRDFAVPAGGQLRAPAHDRLRGVAHQVEHCLNQLLLVTVHERARLLGATPVIESSPDRGTRITIRFTRAGGARAHQP